MLDQADKDSDVASRLATFQKAQTHLNELRSTQSAAEHAKEARVHDYEDLRKLVHESRGYDNMHLEKLKDEPSFNEAKEQLGNAGFKDYTFVKDPTDYRI